MDNLAFLTNWTDAGATLVIDDGKRRTEYFVPVANLEKLDSDLHGYLYERAEMLTGRHLSLFDEAALI